jgi:hypothetical protein
MHMGGHIGVIETIRANGAPAHAGTVLLRHPINDDAIKCLKRNTERSVVQAHQAMHVRQCADSMPLHRVIVALRADHDQTA